MHHFFSEAIENLLVAKKSDLKAYVGKHLTPRGGSDFEGVGGI